MAEWQILAYSSGEWLWVSVRSEEQLMGYRQSQLACLSLSSVWTNVSESDNEEHRGNAGSQTSALALNPLFPNRKTNLKCGNTLENIHQWELAVTDVIWRVGFIGLNERYSCSAHLCLKWRKHMFSFWIALPCGCLGQLFCLSLLVCQYWRWILGICWKKPYKGQSGFLGWLSFLLLLMWQILVTKHPAHPSVWNSEEYIGKAGKCLLCQ